MSEKIECLVLPAERYSTQKIKLPKGKTWTKDAQCFKEKEHLFSKIFF